MLGKILAAHKISWDMVETAQHLPKRQIPASWVNDDGGKIIRLFHRDPDTARGIILQVLRRSWGMAAFRENARLIVRRLGRVGDARASATIRNSESTHRRLRRIYENAAEHYRCVTTSGKHGRRH